MTKLTITEGLAEIKTINARLQKKREAVLGNVARDKALVDPMEKSGGQADFVAKELQGIRDLEKRIVAIRLAIQVANQRNTVSVSGEEATVAEWLNWRREIAGNAKGFLGQIMSRVTGLRDQASKKGYGVRGAQEPEMEQRRELIVNVDEAALYAQIEATEKKLGDLDGRLSLFNATAMIELE